MSTRVHHEVTRCLLRKKQTRAYSTDERAHLLDSQLHPSRHNSENFESTGNNSTVTQMKQQSLKSKPLSESHRRQVQDQA